jgi:hypothetical protein
MAGLVPATPIIWHRRALTIGVAGTSPAMTVVDFTPPDAYAVAALRPIGQLTPVPPRPQ